MLNVRVGLSISSKSTTENGLRRTASQELTTFVVADVARGRTDQPRHRVLLHVLARVEGSARLVTEEEPGERLGGLGSLTPEGPRKMNGKRALGVRGRPVPDRSTPP